MGEPLSAATILAGAAAMTGSTALTDAARVGLHEILRAFNDEADLSPQLRPMVEQQLIGTVATHQMLLADRAVEPGIAQERIVRPLMVCGMPRSGTTLLHCLLGEDPNHRTVRLWERWFPSGRAGDVTQRQAQGDAVIGQILDGWPGFLKAHPYWDALGQATAECDDFLQLSFASLYFAAFHHVPGYSRWLTTVDFTPYYEFHREFLQHLQHGAPPARWVLKGVSHGYYADEIKATYPDAVMIWPHRDIVAQLASNLELGAIVRVIDDPEERAVVASDWLDYTEDGLRRGLASPLFDDEDFLCHVAFEDLVARPVETVRAIYRRYDLPFGEDLPGRLEAWLANPANASDRYGKFSYELSHFGLDRDELAERFSFYGERLGDRLARGLP